MISMWIVNKRNLIAINLDYVSDIGIYSTDSKHFIQVSRQNGSKNKEQLLAYYNSKEEAVATLNKICVALETPNKRICYI